MDIPEFKKLPIMAILRGVKADLIEPVIGPALFYQA